MNCISAEPTPSLLDSQQTIKLHVQFVERFNFIPFVFGIQVINVIYSHLD
jgi:hypothetical protein